jgi:DeoR family fructose operon transcriptional repressor
MYQKERIDAILSILRKQGYATAKQISADLGYSTATVNRDLNLMEKQQLVRRSYGGVEPIENVYVPLLFRYAKNKSVKKRLCKCAAGFVEPGDTIFIDASSTTQFMGEYLTEIEGVTVITPNLALAVFLLEHGVKTIVLGGRVAEEPYFLGSSETVEAVRHYRADKCFVSPGGVNEWGEIGASEQTVELHREFLTRSKKAFYLFHANKFFYHKQSFTTFSHIDVVITDVDYSKEFGEKFPDTKFLIAGHEGTAK